MEADNPIRLSCLGAIAERYDVFLIDMWGTIYDRDVGLYPEAAQCLRKLKRIGATVVLTSNAARPAALEVERQLGASLDRGAYDHVVTAGEVLRDLVCAGAEPRGLPGSRYLMVGHARNADLLTDFGYTEVAEVGEADFLVMAGLAGGDESRAIGDAPFRETKRVLKRALDRALPLFVAKTDWVTGREDGTAWLGPGFFLQWYGARGGRVITVGKPGSAYYAYCDRLVAGPGPRVLAVGDALETDIAGGAGAGHDTLLVRGGLVDRLADPVILASVRAAREADDGSARTEGADYEIDRLRW